MFCDVVSGSCCYNLAIEKLQIEGFKEIMISGSLLWNVQRLKKFATVVLCLRLSMFVMIGNERCVLSVIERYKGESP